MMRAGAIARTGAEITQVRFTCVVLLSMLLACILASNNVNGFGTA
jgi:hypothetical protein